MARAFAIVALLLLPLVVPFGAVATGLSCEATHGTLSTPVQTGLTRAAYAHAAATTTTYYVLHDVGLFLTTLAGTECVTVDCGPSTATCTAPAGSYTVHVYGRITGMQPFALVTVGCALGQPATCASTG